VPAIIAAGLRARVLLGFAYFGSTQNAHKGPASWPNPAEIELRTPTVDRSPAVESSATGAAAGWDGCLDDAVRYESGDIAGTVMVR